MIYMRMDCSQLDFTVYQSSSGWIATGYHKDGRWTEDKIGFTSREKAMEFIREVNGNYVEMEL